MSHCSKCSPNPCHCGGSCRNLLFEKDKYYCRYATSVYNEFRRMKYGIASCTILDDLMIDAVRKDIVDYQANNDAGALTEVSINHMSWLPVYFPTNDDSCEYQSPWDMNRFCVKRSCTGPTGIGMSYVNQNTSTNLIEVNAGGCITRININPSITINTGASFVYTQNCASPALVWHVIHNLSYVPNAWMEDCNGEDISGTVTVVDNNQIDITFSSPQAGKAYLS